MPFQFSMFEELIPLPEEEEQLNSIECDMLGEVVVGGLNFLRKNGLTLKMIFQKDCFINFINKKNAVILNRD